MTNENNFTKIPPDDPPPVFKSWDQLYIFVLVLHALIIAAFYIFTRIYS